MHDRTRQPRFFRILSHTSLFVLALMLLYAFPIRTRAQVPPSETPPAARQEMPHKDELVPLTKAQQQARQLAARLGGRQTSSRDSSSSPRTPLAVVTTQTVRLGISLFTLAHLEGRLIGGQRTFISPVDYAPSSAQADARRPLFIPALEEAFMALEVLAK